MSLHLIVLVTKNNSVAQDTVFLAQQENLSWSPSQKEIAFFIVDFGHVRLQSLELKNVLEPHISFRNKLWLVGSRNRLMQLNKLREHKYLSYFIAHINFTF